MNRLALSMIVRDAEKWLPACLESVRAAAGHIAIADTGSTDHTMEIARGFGAAVISIPWTNDFAAARNRALAAVNSDWVLSLDADEQLDSTASKKIPALLEDASCSGYQVTIRNYVLSLDDRIWDRPAKHNDSLLATAAAYPAYVEHENVRLFRRHPDIYFVGRVHESVGSRILATGRRLAQANFFIHHFGLAADQETRAHKNHLYRDLGRQKIKEMPEDAQAHLELGLVELDNFGNFEEAQALFERACQLNPRFGLAWFFRGLTLLKLDLPMETLDCLEQAERAGLRTSLVSETRGDAHYNLGHFEQASKCYLTAMKQDAENPGLLSKYGLATLRSGQAEIGLRELRAAVRSRPRAPDLHDRLILGCVALTRIEEAAGAAQVKLDSVERPQPGDFLRAASLWANSKNWPRALAALKSGLAVFPGSEKLDRALAEAGNAGGVPKLASSSK
jgi:glycosyltransferase involved in cell wall biosynthesis